MKTTNWAQRINGKLVVAAKRKVTLHISAADVRKGNTKDPGACAAALAAMREIPNCVAARVHLGRVYLLQKDKWLKFKTPEALRGEIIAFDRGGKFEPGDYDLRPMSPSDDPKVRREYSRSETNRRGAKNAINKMPRKLHVVKGVRQHGANR